MHNFCLKVNCIIFNILLLLYNYYYYISVQVRITYAYVVRYTIYDGHYGGNDDKSKRQGEEEITGKLEKDKKVRVKSPRSRNILLINTKIIIYLKEQLNNYTDIAITIRVNRTRRIN